MAQILSGKEVSGELQNAIKSEIAAIREDHPEFNPGLAIVQVGGREDSNVYIRMKCKSAEAVGMSARHINLPQSTTEQELLDVVHSLNEDVNTHGIIVQLPLDSVNDINTDLIINSIAPKKDVDGLNGENAAMLSRGDMSNCIVPCTPRGCLELIKKAGAEVEGARAVVLGRSKIVGSPMANLLTWHNATVTICHSRTKNLASVCKEADILVAAVGRPEMVKADWVKPGAVVIDCGINAIPDATKKSGQRLVGDVAYKECKEVASWITPVPGGVGPMTVAMLIRNTVDGAKRDLQISKQSFPSHLESNIMGPLFQTFRIPKTLSTSIGSLATIMTKNKSVLKFLRFLRR
ncbi:unnamed protein product [Owenia fusiformis]|uniref:C-1-tetrahydrofolate synthase, cytoplasmic n=1 Tax=Owenia fusiformis TaxID=6347 RepID=A0A8S4NT62_OWEFU|nr:unnamed protein product [Owenia fusiformis]